MLQRLKPAVSFVRDVIREFAQDRGALFAAAISYYGLISLIPLLLLAIAVFGHVMGSYATARQQVAQFVHTLIPVGAQEIERNLEQLSRQSSLLGGLGLLGLLWVGSQVFVTLREVMDIALGAEKRSSFLKSRGIALGTVIVAGLLFALSIGITSLLTAVRSLDLGIELDSLSQFWDFLGILLPFSLSILAFVFTYRFLPSKNIGLAGPLIGGIAAGVLFEAAKHAFSWYVAHVADFTRIYGSLGGVVVLVLWIYYVSIITVLGAEVASVYAKWTGDSAG
jgi:membrane protein